MVGEFEDEDDVDKRVISMDGLGIQIIGPLSPDARQGLDLYLEIQRFESQLVDSQHANYNVLGRVVSKSFAHLRRKRHRYNGKYDIRVEYRNARTAVARKDIEDALIALSAFQTELALCYQDSWRVIE